MSERAPQLRDFQQGNGLAGFAAGLLHDRYTTLVFLTYGCLALVFLSPPDQVAEMWRSGSWWIVVLVSLVVLAGAGLTFLLGEWNSALVRWLARGVTSFAPVLSLIYLLFLR